MARFSSPITKSKVTLGLRKAENSQKLIPLLLLGDRGGRLVLTSREPMHNPEQQFFTFGQKSSLLQTPQPRNIQDVLKGQEGR